jgi:hypothetical protein
LADVDEDEEDDDGVLAHPARTLAPARTATAAAIALESFMLAPVQIREY